MVGSNENNGTVAEDVECSTRKRKHRDIDGALVFSTLASDSSEGEGVCNLLWSEKRCCRDVCDRKCQCVSRNSLPSSEEGDVPVNCKILVNDYTLSKGEQVRNLCEIIQTRMLNRKRQPNINCRVEAFGRVCSEFDDVRNKWVVEMGFGGLLHIVGMTLPRMLCYWLMTRVDPKNEMLDLNDGRYCSLAPNQVRWVLGLPNGGKAVPRAIVDDEMKERVKAIHDKFGFQWHGTIRKSGKVISSNGLAVTDTVLEELKGEWKQEDEEEFKTLFLLTALYMILCPTQSKSLETDLVPALTCAMKAAEYDWCGLVLEKLMASVKRFAKRFNAEGYAGGCGGCSLFVAILYLDRLRRKPVRWGLWPRVKAWNAEELRKGSRDDRRTCGGDFGALPSIDATYGDMHPLDSGDREAPPNDVVDVTVLPPCSLKFRGRKSRSKSVN